MSNVIPLHDPAHEQRRIRGAFVKECLDADGRSARYVAARVGISNTAFSDRLKGKAPFLADELELVAQVLKLDPIDFYRDYLTAGSDGGPVAPDSGPVNDPKQNHLALITNIAEWRKTA